MKTKHSFTDYKPISEKGNVSIRYLMKTTTRLDCDDIEIALDKYLYEKGYKRKYSNEHYKILFYEDKIPYIDLVIEPISEER